MENIEDLKKRAKELYNDDQYDDALKLYLKIIESTPNDPFCLFRIAYCYTNSNQNIDREKGVEYYKKALSIDQSDKITWSNLGWLYRDLNKHQESLECGLKSIEIDPNYVKSLRLLSYAYESLKDPKKARDYYEQTFKLDSQNATFTFNYADFLEKNNEIKKAIPFYKKAIEINPDYVKAWIRLGEIYKYDKKRNNPRKSRI